MTSAISFSTIWNALCSVYHYLMSICCFLTNLEAGCDKFICPKELVVMGPRIGMYFSSGYFEKNFYSNFISLSMFSWTWFFKSFLPIFIEKAWGLYIFSNP
jgi:hypothetical protein